MKPVQTPPGYPPTPPCVPSSARKRPKSRHSLRFFGRYLQQQGAFARYVSKRLLTFLAVAIIVVAVNIIVYVDVMLYMDGRTGAQEAFPTFLKQVDGELAQQQNGQWTIDDQTLATVYDRGLWLQLVDAQGQVIWSENAPDELPQSYTTTQMALAAHAHKVNDCPVYIWDHGDGSLLIMGVPSEAYWTSNGYIGGDATFGIFFNIVFIVDVLIFVLYTWISWRSMRRTVGPITDALDDLSKGRPVSLAYGGDLSQIVQSVNEASDIIRRKDQARESWIKGVSHDIRTPLSMITGYADSITHDATTSDQSRAYALTIRAQSLRIKDLVYDLNAASQLEYDNQPLHCEPIAVTSLVRSTVVEYLNAMPEGKYCIECQCSNAAGDTRLDGDVHLLQRALHNLIQNAINHNPDGCTINVHLDVEMCNDESRESSEVCADNKAHTGGETCTNNEMHSVDGATADVTAYDDVATAHNDNAAPDGPKGRCVRISVTDDGIGIAADDLTTLRAKLASADSDRLAHTSVAEHGLGLVLVSRIAHAHGGLLNVDGSARGKAVHGRFAATIILPIDTSDSLHNVSSRK
ncbi:MAG: HAMP domain-containing histidine kinase [Eggerthellaceae bacterium]|nr:HAMP domain-containing histidine kinase [Eggerthellaceae bacterium]